MYVLLTAAALLVTATVNPKCSPPYDDCTDSVQASLDSCATEVDIYPLPGQQSWPVLPLHVTCDNQKIVLHAGVILEAKRWAFNASGATLLTLDGVSNVSISGNGAALRMHRADYDNPKWYKYAQGRHGIALRGVRHVSISGLTVSETGGDGVYITKSYKWKSASWSQNIIMDGMTLSRNYRQGMSVIAVDGLTVTNTLLSETGSEGMGHPPMAGVDFEPNDETQPLRGVRFTNVTARNNTGRGFQWSLTHNTPQTPPLDIVFERCVVEGGGSYGISLSGSGHGGVPTGGKLQLLDMHVSLNNASGLLIENKNGGPMMVLKNLTLDRVARNGGAPIWLEGQSHLCTGASFDAVRIEDDRDRIPINAMGNLSRMSGAIQVHNTLLTKEHCKSSHQLLPNVTISCNATTSISK